MPSDVAIASFRHSTLNTAEGSAQRVLVRLPVLMYHHVGDAPSGFCPGLSVPRDLFARQIRWLARHGYASIRAADWLAWVREGKPLPAKPILLTFDDGYADTAQCALPILKQYGFSGLVFVVSSLIGHTNQWDEAQGYPSVRLMTVEQIRRWAGQGMEFGAHSRTHLDLTRLSPERLEEEVNGSGDELEEILQTRVISFAYPGGVVNAQVRQAVSKVFDLSFTIEEGLNTLATDLLAQRRIMVFPRGPLFRFGWRAQYGFDPIHRFAKHLYGSIRGGARA
jgi:peptidoglycan/xylan/chitin deacetylase (PgdA/CDA1 family)